MLRPGGEWRELLPDAPVRGEKGKLDERLGVATERAAVAVGNALVA